MERNPSTTPEDQPMSEPAPGLEFGSPVAEGCAADLFGALEEKVTRLVERHREARKTIQDLRAQLRERERQIGELTEKAYTLGRVRDEAQKRLDALIDEIDHLQADGGRG